MSLFPIIAADESAAEEVSLPAFVVARDGLYLRKRSLLGLSQVQVDEVAHLPAAREYLEYELPKVPASLMGQVVGFFRAIWSRQKSEALALLIWDGSVFGLIVPEQRAGAASVKHRLETSDVPSGAHLVGSIHSHGALSAGASLTDEADEADFDGIHVVVGDVDERRPSYSAAIVVDGRRFAHLERIVMWLPDREVGS
jgi:PRTRC genetic system protein A